MVRRCPLLLASGNEDVVDSFAIGIYLAGLMSSLQLTFHALCACDVTQRPPPPPPPRKKQKTSTQMREWMFWDALSIVLPFDFLTF